MKDREFRFVSETHTYWLDDVEMPSLSRIISPLNDFVSVHPDVLNAKAQAGTDIHKTVELWLAGCLDMDNLAEGNRIALDLFIGWYKKTAGDYGKPVCVEVPTYHHKLLYGTTPDIVFEEAIIEIKTRPYKKIRDDVQLIAQSKCFPEFPPKRLMVLSLDIVARKYTFQSAENKQAWSIFRKLLDKYRLDCEVEALIKNLKGG